MSAKNVDKHNRFRSINMISLLLIASLNFIATTLCVIINIISEFLFQATVLCRNTPMKSIGVFCVNSH